jgi:hypothetical protein
MASGPAGLLVIRARTERGSAKRLRANVRLTFDTEAGFTSEVNLADVEAVVAVVRHWLDDLLEDPRGAGGATVTSS